MAMFNSHSLLGENKLKKPFLHLPDPHLHHVLEDIALGVSVGVPLGLADDDIVLEKEDVPMVASG